MVACSAWNVGAASSSRTRRRSVLPESDSAILTVGIAGTAGNGREGLEYGWIGYVRRVVRRGRRPCRRREISVPVLPLGTDAQGVSEGG